jgi:hypothetical protein
VLLGDLLDDREAEAAALLSARILAAVEAVEDMREVCGIDAISVIADPNFAGADGDLDGAGGG